MWKFLATLIAGLIVSTLVVACGENVAVLLPGPTVAVSTSTAVVPAANAVVPSVNALPPTPTSIPSTVMPATATALPPSATPIPATATTLPATEIPTTTAPTVNIVPAVMPTVITASNPTPAAAIAPGTVAVANPLPTPILKPNNGFTPAPLGASEGLLKATGFDGNSAKALLDGLTTEVGVRVLDTPGELKAANWIEQKFKLFGYSRVEQQTFQASINPNIGAYLGKPSATQGKTLTDVKGINVVAIRPANKPDAKILIFGGHYDTVLDTQGASDNASGTATTLEIARVIINRYPDYELRFALFGGEEAGLLGSKAYVKLLPASVRARVVSFINLDALGVGERFVAIGSPDLVALSIDLATRNGIRLEPFNLAGTRAASDHFSFIDGGIKSLFLSRWSDPEIHTPGDTPDRNFAETLLLGGGMAILFAEELMKRQPA